MSRSRRKHPFTAFTTSSSDKRDKRRANRKFRRKERVAIVNDEQPPENTEEVSDVYTFSKDGKHMFDEEEHPNLMRK
jgi:hypothetical protein